MISWVCPSGVIALLLTTITAIDTSHSSFSVTLSEKCKVNLTVKCVQDLLNQIMILTVKTLSQEVRQSRSLPLYRNISFPDQNLEVQVFVIGPKVALNETPQFVTNDVSVDFSLDIISTKNTTSVAVAFMSYSDIKDNLKLRFFNPLKTLVSSVMLARLPKTTKTNLIKPVNFAFKHIVKDGDPEVRFSCAYWNGNEWVEDSHAVIHTNSTHTVCSCDYSSMLALVMEIVPCKTLFGVMVSLQCNAVLNKTIAHGVGVVFLTLCLLTFTFFLRNTTDTTTALIDLCLNLLVFHLLDLLKPLFRLHLQPPQACAVMTGIRRYFFFSTFVWMFIESVLLLLRAVNLSKVRSNQKKRISWKWLHLIGYLTPLAAVIMCAVVFLQNSYNDDESYDECWGTRETDMILDIPVLVVVASNMILYIVTIIVMIFNLKHLKNKNLQKTNTSDTSLIMRVMFISLAQFCILGSYWIFLYVADVNGVLYNVFLFLNSQQGTFVFLVHCLLIQEVRQNYGKCLCELRCFRLPIQKILKSLRSCF